MKPVLLRKADQTRRPSEPVLPVDAKCFQLQICRPLLQTGELELVQAMTIKVWEIRLLIGWRLRTLRSKRLSRLGLGLGRGLFDSLGKRVLG
jgi:hypothetical protein